MRRRSIGGLARVLLVLVVAWGCGNDVEGTPTAEGHAAEGKRARGAGADETLRFRLADENVLLVWYDEQGAPHPVEDVAEIPEAHRAEVRVDVLSDEGAHRAPAGSLYVADLTGVEESAELVARSVSRDAFDAQLRARAPLPEKPPPGAATSEANVILYGTRWCGACKQARQFLKARGIPFRDRDIEKEPGARSELMQKAKQAGLRTQGVPVIDVNGTLMQGFDPGRLVALLEAPAAKP